MLRRQERKDGKHDPPKCENQRSDQHVMGALALVAEKGHQRAVRKNMILEERGRAEQDEGSDTKITTQDEHHRNEHDCGDKA